MTTITLVFLPQLCHQQYGSKPDEKSRHRPPRHPARAIAEAQTEWGTAGAEGPRILHPEAKKMSSAEFGECLRVNLMRNCQNFDEYQRAALRQHFAPQHIHGDSCPEMRNFGVAIFGIFNISVPQYRRHVSTPALLRLNSIPLARAGCRLQDAARRAAQLARMRTNFRSPYKFDN